MKEPREGVHLNETREERQEEKIRLQETLTVRICGDSLIKEAPEA